MKIKGGCMERKVGEVFNDGENKIEVVEYDGSCIDCFYDRLPKCPSGCTNTDLKFIKIGEQKMDNKEELKRSLAEEEQRAKDSLANVEKMKKQLEELNKKEVEVSATGVLLEQPQKNSTFFANHGDNSTQTENYNFENYEKGCFNVNNVFSTKEFANQESLRREGQEFIRRCAMLWNKGNDWRKKDTLYQCHLYFKPSSNSLCYMYDNNIAKGIPYFDNIALSEKCIAELKNKYNDEQIKTIFGVK